MNTIPCKKLSQCPPEGPADVHLDHQRIKDLFHKHKNVRLCLSGHVHYVDEIEYLGVKYPRNEDGTSEEKSPHTIRLSKKI